MNLFFNDALSLARFLNSRKALELAQKEPGLPETQLWQKGHNLLLVWNIADREDQAQLKSIAKIFSGRETAAPTAEPGWTPLQWGQFALQMEPLPTKRTPTLALPMGEMLFRIRGDQDQLRAAIDILLSYQPGAEDQAIWFYDISPNDQQSDILLWANPFRATAHLLRLPRENVRVYVPYNQKWPDLLAENTGPEGFARGLFVEHGLKFPLCYGLANIFQGLGAQQQQLILRGSSPEWSLQTSIRPEHVQGLFNVTHFSLAQQNEAQIQAAPPSRPPTRGFFEVQLKPKPIFLEDADLKSRILASYGVLASLAIRISEMEELQEQIKLEKEIEAAPGATTSFAGEQALPSTASSGLERLYVFVDSVADQSFESNALRQMCLTLPYSVLEKSSYAFYTVHWPVINQAAAPQGQTAVLPTIAQNPAAPTTQPVTLQIHLVRAAPGAAAQAFLESSWEQVKPRLFLSSPRWSRNAHIDIFLRATQGKLRQDLFPFLFPVTPPNMAEQLRQRAAGSQKKLEPVDQVDVEAVITFLESLSPGYVNEAGETVLRNAISSKKPGTQLVILEPRYLSRLLNQQQTQDALALPIHPDDFRSLLTVVREELSLNNRLGIAEELKESAQRQLERTVLNSFANLASPYAQKEIERAVDRTHQEMLDLANEPFKALWEEANNLQNRYQATRANVESALANHEKTSAGAVKTVADLYQLAQQMAALAGTAQGKWSDLLNLLVKEEGVLHPSDRKIKRLNKNIQKMQTTANRLKPAELRVTGEQLVRALNISASFTTDELLRLSELSRKMVDLLEEMRRLPHGATQNSTPPRP